MTTAARNAAERAHYGDFYDETWRADDRPLLVVMGNCQAESLRRLMDADDVRSVRVPPVHELGSGDLEPLQHLVARTALLVSQPVSDDYRGLPLGTAQLRAQLPPGARVALVPTIRYAGLHPWQVVVHPPGLPDPVPPVVAYHDLRTVAAAAGIAAGAPVGAAQVLAVAQASVDELRRRERLHDTVVASDLLTHPTATTVRVINHPGNEVLAPVAARLRAALGLDARPPGTAAPLLTSVWAPLEPVVLAAHGLDAEPRAHWLVDGVEVPAEHVAAEQTAWYAERPDVLDAVLRRTEAVRAVLGLSPDGPPAAAASERSGRPPAP